MVNNHVANRGNIDMIIYEARNKINDKRYIGQTIHTLSRKIRTTNEDTFVYHGISWKVIK